MEEREPPLTEKHLVPACSLRIRSTIPDHHQSSITQGEAVSLAGSQASSHSFWGCRARSVPSKTGCKSQNNLKFAPSHLYTSWVSTLSGNKYDQSEQGHRANEHFGGEEKRLGIEARHVRTNPVLPSPVRLTQRPCYTVTLGQEPPGPNRIFWMSKKTDRLPFW